MLIDENVKPNSRIFTLDADSRQVIVQNLNRLEEFGISAAKQSSVGYALRLIFGMVEQIKGMACIALSLIAWVVGSKGLGFPVKRKRT